MFWFNHGKGIYFSYNIAHSVAFIICNYQKKQTYSGLSFNTSTVSSQHITPITQKNIIILNKKAIFYSIQCFFME